VWHTGRAGSLHAPEGFSPHGRHACVAGSQYGVEPKQSAFVRQSTHDPVSTRHRSAGEIIEHRSGFTSLHSVQRPASAPLDWHTGREESVHATAGATVQERHEFVAGSQ
jgi:hypothetical protein